MRYGARLDLQFGQATDTLQGNPSECSAAADLQEYLSGVWDVKCVPLGKWTYGGLWQVGEFAGDRGELYERPGELFAVVLLRLSSVLPHGVRAEVTKVNNKLALRTTGL